MAQDGCDKKDQIFTLFPCASASVVVRQTCMPLLDVDIFDGHFRLEGILDAIFKGLLFSAVL